MKRFLELLLSMLLLCGCASMPPAETTVPAVSTETTEDPYFAPATTAETESPSKEPTVIPADLAANKTTFAIGECYWDFEIYPDSSLRQLDLYILSAKKLTSDDVSVDIAVSCPYTVNLYELPQGNAPRNLAYDSDAVVEFTYDIYLHYCGFDWGELAEKYRVMEQMQETVAQDNTAENRAAYKQVATAYQEYYNSHWDDYVLLTKYMLPQFRYYQLAIVFDPSSAEVNEKFTNLTVTVGENSIVKEIGEVRIYSEDFVQSSAESSDYLKDYWLSALTPVTQLSGMLDVTLTDFTATEDMLLTGLDFVTGGFELAEVQLKIEADRGNATDFIWDCKSPIPVTANSYLAFLATFDDARLERAGFVVKGFLVIEYEVDGIAYQRSHEHQLKHTPNCFETYAKYFDGIDFTEYYEEYYYPIVLGIELQGDT